MKKTVSVILILSMLLTALVFSVFAAAPSSDDIVNAAIEIICSKEGTYTDVVADDNGALSIGLLQWHGNRALNLLRDIVNANTSNAKSILGTTLYDEILTASSWSTRILTADETAKISSLLGTAEGKAEQEELRYNDVLSYIKHGQTLGLTSPAALVYFADIENQCGSGGSTRVYKAALALASDGNVTLAILHQAALADSSAGSFTVRRNSVYDYCALLGWEDDGISEAYEVWIVTAEPSLKIRSGAGTSYSKVGSYSTGTEIIVFEQTTAEGYTWGRTSIGWVALDYCEFVSRHEPESNSFSVTFNVNGGTLGVSPKATLTLTGINVSRGTNALVVYDSKRGTTTSTNIYGAEISVDSSGCALNGTSPAVNNSSIPSGGFVISAHGEAVAKLSSAVSKGNYVSYSSSDMTLRSYSDYTAYITENKTAANGSAIGTLPAPTREGYIFAGWYDENGIKYTENTVVYHNSSFTLTAKWTPVSVKVSFDANDGSAVAEKTSVTANGLNCYRNTDMLVIYDKDRGTTTNTNKYGTEVAVNSAGTVTDIWKESASGTGNHTIPSGGFVLSGHGAMSTWLINNITVGDCIKFDNSTLLVTVYTSSVQTFDSITATYGTALGTLPTPTRDGYIFAGWATESGTVVTAKTVSAFTKDITLYAQWADQSIDHIAGDINMDGKVNALDSACILQQIKNPELCNYIYADINGDGKVNALDSAAELKIIKDVK